MRKMWTAATALAVGALVMVGVAMAAPTQVNTYTVKGGVKGAKGATKKKPKPVSLNFDYTVGEEHGLRPSVVTKYSIFFEGGQVNNTAFKGCDAKKLNAPGGGLKVCPKASIVGGGRLRNATGKTSDPTEINPALACNLHITLVNSTKKNHFLIWLNGQPGDPDVSQKCAIAIHQAIDGKFVKRTVGGKKGTALEFRVADNLLHPLAGLDNSVVQVQSNIKKLTAKKHGKKVGFFEGFMCKSKQTISVTFTQEAGNVSRTQGTTYKCK